MMNGKGHISPTRQESAGAVTLPPMQLIRSARFEIALRNFIRAKGESWACNTPRNWAADFMADMMHWCDCNQVDFAELEKLASGHHRSESEFDVDMQHVGVVNSLPPITPH